MKTVLMLYPIVPFVDRDPEFPQARGCLMDSLGGFWTKVLGLKSGEFRDRCGLVNVLLERYREEAFVVNWAYFGQSGFVSAPDVAQHSDVFEVCRGDGILSVGTSYFGHIRNHFYPDEEKVLGRLGVDELVVGGFHENDCVPRFVEAGKRLGIKSSYDRLLTDHFFFSIFESFVHDSFARAIATGHLDPVMHEDDPAEEKRLLFGGRLDAYL